MASLFKARGFPCEVLTAGQRKAGNISRQRALERSGQLASFERSERVRIVLTYHPKNQDVKVLLRNFGILIDDPRTKELFTTPMCVYRRDTNLRDILFHSTLSSHPDQTQAGTFPYKRARSRTRAFTGGTASINHTNGVVHLKERHSCTTTSVPSFVPAVKFCTLENWSSARRQIRRAPPLRGFTVAKHFNQPGHNSINMPLYVIKKVMG